MSSNLMRVGTGRVGTLTPEQQTILDQFKAKLHETGYWNEERHDDYMLLRFLRARKFVIDNAYEMIKNYEDWRKETDVDNLVRTFQIPHADEVAKLYPRFYHNIDKNYRPIYVEQLGKINLAALCDLLGPDGVSAKEKSDKTLEIMLKHFVVGYESLLNGRFPACSKVAGHHIDQCFTILDIKDVGLSQISTVLPFIRATSKIAQDYYPEMMGKMFIINAPFLFRGTWSMVKGFLDPVTQSKISILGTSYSKELLTEIEPSHLPKMYGGTCECALGCDMSDVGPWPRQSVNTPNFAETTIQDIQESS